MRAVASTAMRDGLRNSADAVGSFMQGCEELRGRVGREVVAEHMGLCLKRMQALRDDLLVRADRAASGDDAMFIALGQGAAGLASLAKAFAEMHARYKATLPGSPEAMGWFDEEDAEVPI